MNGETKLKLRGGLVGGVIGVVLTLILTFGTISYGYGQLNGRVFELEKKVECIEDVRERLVRVETIVERIDKKIP